MEALEVVAVTGGCGSLGGHVIRVLADNPLIKEIRVLDRRITYADSSPKVKYIGIELTDADALSTALYGVNSVIHLAKANIPLHYGTAEEMDAMWRDNVEATEVLVEKMKERKISRLIYVGDAYSNLPIDDNYGLSEDMHSDLPPHFLLGEYGESRCRAEQCARRVVDKDPNLSGLFLRPVWTYSENLGSFWREILKMARNGQLPYVQSTRRALHQFIYAGNLARLIEKSLFLLKKDPQYYSGEIVYCNDDTKATSITELIADLADSPLFSSKNETSFIKSLLTHSFNHLLYKCGSSQVSSEMLHLHTYRTIFEKTLGFSDKKLRIFLEYKPEVKPSEAMRRFVEAARKQAPNYKEDTIEGKEVHTDKISLRSVSNWALRIPRFSGLMCDMKMRQ